MDSACSAGYYAVPAAGAFMLPVDPFSQHEASKRSELPEFSVKAEYPQIHSRNDKKGFQLRILGIPPSGTKSRVETQIKICIQLLTSVGEKASYWSQLKLPENLIMKEKTKVTRHSDLHASLSNHMLQLEASVVCASDVTKQVPACFGCIQRERKRAKRKKEQANTKSVPPSEASSPTGDHSQNQLVPDSSSASDVQSDQQKILMFNCSEFVDFSTGDAILPTRITCYCRHHNEKTGFCLYFCLKDHAGDVIASGLSPPIMITDDHKSSKIRGVKRQRVDSAIPLVATQPYFLPSTFGGDSSFRRYEIPPSPASPSSHPSFQSLVPNGMTPNGMHMPTHTSFHSPPSQNDFSKFEARFPFDEGPKTGALIKEEGLEPLEPQFDFSDNGFELSDKLSPEADADAEQGPPGPEIARVVPTEGPLHGGIEVTILGSNFFNGIRVMFGDNEAFSTHFWGSTTLICILPPSTVPGLVPVTIKEMRNPPQLSSPFAGVPSTSDEAAGLSSSPAQNQLDFADSMLNTDIVMFNYREDTEKELMELALKVVGMKLTGKAEDAKNIALAILNQVSLQHRDPSGFTNKEAGVMETLRTVLQFPSEFEADLSFQSKTQHTMLHLAVIMNWPNLCSFLIDNDVHLDITDRNEFTALHYASWLGRSAILKMLYLSGASTSIRNAYGQTARDLTHPKIAGIWDIISSEVAQQLTEESAISTPSPPPSSSLQDEFLPFSLSPRSSSLDPSSSSSSSLPSLSPPPSSPAPAPPSSPSSPPTMHDASSSSFGSGLAYPPSPPPKELGRSISSDSMENISGDLGCEPQRSYLRVSKVEKQGRRKRDRMTFNFWLPLFCVVAALALFQFLSPEANPRETIQNLLGFEIGVNA